MKTTSDILQKNKDLILSSESVLERQEGCLYQFKAKLILKNGSSLYISEVWKDKYRIKYSYYWFDVEENMIMDWDNAPHYPRLKSFPHHKHIGKKGNVEGSYEIPLTEIFDIIRHKIKKGTRRFRN